MLDVPQPRLANPAFAVAGVFDALQALGVAVASVGLEPRLLELVKMRASQINRCAVCLEGHGRLLRRAGETDARLDSLAGWRDSPHFAPAERAALALTEAATRLADRDDPVPDAVWDDAAATFPPPHLAALVVTIGAINLFNRLNVATRQQGGSWQP
jgi:AhpD family alkylhydroperoxidase